jgi:predicted permease
MHLAGTILPIFAIILTGWFAGASGYMPRALAAPLMRFAYYVAMPSLVFLTIADQSLHSLLDWRFIAAFGGGSMICFVAVMIFVRIAWGAGVGKSGILAAAVSMTNTGFVALPILKSLFGPPGVLAAADRHQSRHPCHDFRTALVDARFGTVRTGHVISHGARRSVDAMRAVRNWT